MQDRPTAAELLDAAAEFLEREVMTELGGRKGFLVRVTVNVLRILEREARLELDAVAAERERLHALLGSDAGNDVRDLNLELGRRIRSSDLDDRTDELIDALYATAVDKLRIANPRWLTETDGA